jgi:cytoskeletal protein RodZ
MENLGQYLRSRREEKNITIESVHDEIKLSTEQITAIENNQLSKLGNYGFARAMVYTYIRFLGIDEKIAMNLFDIIWPSQRQANFTPKTPIKEQKVLISINFIWLISIFLFVIVLSTIIWISYDKGYLERPFDKMMQKPDSVKVLTLAEPENEKPDSLRQRMLELAKIQQKPNELAENKQKPVSVKNKKALTDTTDYINELIFQAKESPFNQRF